ncbi:hypothetical protein M409DRAFT_30701 [Zasmidium cellare ATCC 36951]|uniref:RNase III domain-containing protein n=1 Tax=Zasmidium cellare ATCC 36951 TaxID=1080233 RepID=A0A6A6BXP3_ZASCE|nr:uncharacterized protein M409DRAFT_30701 [Zasmidium cellare ATCC 36951]KAF2158828.1 hypothetical protein M409DRAFT_30701 [Zasmidium cellare ATCC 36951]
MAFNTYNNNTADSASPPPSLDVKDADFVIDLGNLELALGYKFNDHALVREAFVGERAQVMIEGKLVRQPNQRLPILGDSVLKTAFWDTNFTKDELCAASCKRFDSFSSNRSLAKEGCYLYIHTMIVCVDGKRYWEKKKWTGEERTTAVASTIEAVIGAVWIDSHQNIETVKSAINGLLGAGKC